MRISILALILTILLSSCIPQGIKEKMNEGMALGQKMLADQEFKKAIAQIELHKLRNGQYPESLSDLQFLSAMDSSMFQFIEYTRLDSVYELNIKMDFPVVGSEQTKQVDITYPPEFWRGLGCVKSNLK